MEDTGRVGGDEILTRSGRDGLFSSGIAAVTVNKFALNSGFKPGQQIPIDLKMLSSISRASSAVVSLRRKQSSTDDRESERYGMVTWPELPGSMVTAASGMAFEWRSD